MAPKKTNIKIKRSKINLYNKKKSKGKRALKVILSIVLVCGLGVLGYGLGKPLMKYFRDRENNSSDTASAIISSIINSATAGFTQSAEPGSVPEVTAPEESQPPQPAITDSTKIFYLPENSLVNEQTLSKALEQAKSSGCTIAAVTMKDEKGCLQYKTSIGALKDTDAVLANAMPPQQIAAAIAKAGFTPAARINTLLDQTGCYYMKAHYQFAPGLGDYAWHDNTVEKGGKTWMSPFKTEARDYIRQVSKELANAGFEHIICANTRYPNFFSVDITQNLSNLPLTDAAKRTEALWGIIDAAKAGADGKELWIEISGTSLVSEKQSSTDAELAANKARLAENKIVVIYDIKSGTRPTSDPSGSENTPYAQAKRFAEQASSALGGAEFAVRIPAAAGNDAADIARALTEAGIVVF